MAPRYIGLYDVVATFSVVAYRLEFPAELGKVHNVFHISQLRSYDNDPPHIFRPEVVELYLKTSYLEKPLKSIVYVVRKTHYFKTRKGKILGFTMD